MATTRKLLELASSPAVVVGTPGNDYMVIETGGVPLMYAYGGDGHDDVMVFDAVEAHVFGGAGSDYVYAERAVTAVLYGGAGNDWLTAYAPWPGVGESLTIYGGADHDTISSYATNYKTVTIYAGDGHDRTDIMPDRESTFFSGGAGNDYLSMQFGVEGHVVTVHGDAGDDNIAAVEGPFAGNIYGDEGNDLFYFAAVSETQVWGGTGDDHFEIYDCAQMNVSGGEGNDSIYATFEGDVPSFIYGNDGNDAIAAYGDTNLSVYGGTGDDRIEVAGGAAAYGQNGRDTFIIDAANALALYSGEVSTIADFNAGGERIELVGFDFIGPVGGSLAATFFHAGSGGLPQDHNDRILFDTDTGALYYDADGNGAETAVQIAAIDIVNGVIDHNDFIVV